MLIAMGRAKWPSRSAGCWVSVAAAVESDPFPAALSPRRHEGCLVSSAWNTFSRDRLTGTSSDSRSNGEVRNSTAAWNGANRIHITTLHAQQCPTSDKAFAELGKAVKTAFLCRYLHSEPLRREIHEGLNVIEHWNGANDFIFFAKRGEFVSNRHEDHEFSMLALHLLQNCLVYINTLMMQQVLSRPDWSTRLTPVDLRALTPLVWEHVNPYGCYELDMETRLALA